MGFREFFTWRPRASATAPTMADEDLIADVDEPPDTRARRDQAQADFQKSRVRPQPDRKESLLTKAFHVPPEHRRDIHITTDLTRRRSLMSNASISSVAELTSDGGLTSPARTNTPSPPFPNTTFSHYSLAAKATPIPATVKTAGHTPLSEVMDVSPKAEPVVQPPKKRCITFMCDGKKEAPAKAATQAAVPVAGKPPATPPTTTAPAPRKSTIKFACPGPKSSTKPAKDEGMKTSLPKGSDSTNRNTSRSPSLPRKSPRQAPRSTPREPSLATRRASQSPVTIRVKPRYIIADEETINSSEATRFHEFASEEVQEDDWIRQDAEIFRDKLTINDTLKKENAIRRLGDEAEAEALEDEEEEEDDDEETQLGNDSDDDETDEDEDEDEDLDSMTYSDDPASDGNESDNEAGFADSDESDAEGEFSFWTPGKRAPGSDSLEALVYRPSAHRTASTSSIDSLNHMEPEACPRKLRRRPIKIRPGTPDLPDSTDFVCGTLDEDRPLEDAYVSCMEARKHAKHKQTPQDIDPSFPTSDPEDEDDEDDDAVGPGHDSDEPVWLHGKFEESDDERYGRRRATAVRRKSPAPSPRRLHSPPPIRKLHSPPPKPRLHSPPPPRRLHSPPPRQRLHSPPPKQRLRSPPPRRLFGHSPKRMHSPPSAQTVQSPAASPTSAKAIAFAPLGSRPGPTHTKSLPRTPNAFCRAYHASRLIAANGNATEGNENNDAHVRGAIDIVKGLEEKRRRRKEKYQKVNNRKNKGHSDRKPLPGKGAERMRELGLLMAGKTGQNDPYMLSA